MADAVQLRSFATLVLALLPTGRRIIFRYAKDFSSPFRRGSQPIRIIIVWKYHSETGQPLAEEQQGMNLLEDALESVLKGDSFATLALVSTGENFREWIYYAKSETEFEARFDYALDRMPPFPIEIHVASDPNWDTYQRFKDDNKEL